LRYIPWPQDDDDRISSSDIWTVKPPGPTEPCISTLAALAALAAATNAEMQRGSIAAYFALAGLAEIPLSVPGLMGVVT
jgi:hypothetical protein